MRERESVTPLELFFDLVFVLALTQCTALMAETPTWEGLAKGLLVLGVLWWCWVGYSWLTSVVDPEEGVVRLVIFAAMAGLLVAALCVPDVFGDTGLLFACAYGVVRAAHIALFLVAAATILGCASRRRVSPAALRSPPGCWSRRRSPTERRRAPCGRWRWCSTWAGRCCSGQDGWKLMPAPLRGAPRADRDHRAGRVDRRDRRRRRARPSTPASSPPRCSAPWSRPRSGGCTSTSSRWWPRGGSATRRRAGSRTASRATRSRCCTCRWWRASCCVALGMKKTLGHVEDPLELVPAVALFGGTAVYLLAHVAFRWRNIHTAERHGSPARGAARSRSCRSASNCRHSRRWRSSPQCSPGSSSTRRCASPKRATGSARSSRTSPLGRDPLPRPAQPEPARAVWLERERELAVELRVLHPEEVDEHALGVERERAPRVARPPRLCTATIVAVAPVGAVREDRRVVLRRAATTRPSRAPGTPGGGGSAAPSS